MNNTSKLVLNEIENGSNHIFKSPSMISELNKLSVKDANINTNNSTNKNNISTGFNSSFLQNNIEIKGEPAKCPVNLLQGNYSQRKNMNSLLITK